MPTAVPAKTCWKTQKAWFTYLRLYAPEADFGKTWKPPDAEKVKIAIKQIPNEPSDFIKRSH